MNLTNTHAQFWLQRKAPAWARAATNSRQIPVTIDDCVNAHVPRTPRDRRFEPHHATNMCAFMRSYRRRGEDLLANLDLLALNPGTLIRPERRAGFARKWAARIRKNRGK